MNKNEFKQAIISYLQNEADYSDDFIRFTESALKRANYGQYKLFHHKLSDGTRQLVLMNTSAPKERLESGIFFGEKNRIEKFKNSDDLASVTINATARCLIMEAIDDENDSLRLRELARYKVCWQIHYTDVEGGGSAGFPIKNIHTHGLTAAFGHKEFQIVLDVGMEQAALILNCLADRVRNGEVFYEGEVINGVYEGCGLKLATVNEGNREVFRVLIPDESNIYPGEAGCKYPYSAQALEV